MTLPVGDDEDVLPRALHHVPGGAEQDRLVVAGLERLHLGQRRVHVLAGALAGGRDRVLVDVLPTRRGGAAALVLGLLAEVGTPRPHRDRDLGLAGQWVEPHLAVAEVEDRPDVAGLDVVDAHRLLGRGDDLLRRELRLKQVDAGGPEQPVDVVGEAEDGRALGCRVCPDALEDAPSVVHGRVQYVDGRIVPVDERTVHPDLLGGRDGHNDSFSTRPIRDDCITRYGGPGRRVGGPGS